MRPARGSTINAIHALRREAADTVDRCDAVIFWSRAAAAADLRTLPARIRALQARCQRALESLAREGIS
jgi:hypothetical protein